MLFKKRLEKRIASYQEEITRKYFDEVSGMYDKMRGWRHDYRHHIQTMKVHMANGDYGQVSEYLDMLDDDLTNVETVVKTGDPMADAVLNSKLSVAVSKKINIKAQAKIPVKLTTPELDFCIILGNLLDNAIEATLPLPEEERLIRIYLEMKGSYLYIHIANSAFGAKKSKVGTRFKSTKSSEHGFGLIRTDEVVKKNGGYITRASEDGAFTTEVLLPQNIQNR